MRKNIILAFMPLFLMSSCTSSAYKRALELVRADIGGEFRKRIKTLEDEFYIRYNYDLKELEVDYGFSSASGNLILTIPEKQPKNIVLVLV